MNNHHPQPGQDLCGKPESALRPSIHHYLEGLIKKKRDEAYMFETLLRELPPLSQEADHAIWELCVANSAFRP